MKIRIILYLSKQNYVCNPSVESTQISIVFLYFIVIWIQIGWMCVIHCVYVTQYVLFIFIHAVALLLFYFQQNCCQFDFLFYARYEYTRCFIFSFVRNPLYSLSYPKIRFRNGSTNKQRTLINPKETIFWILDICNMK